MKLFNCSGSANAVKNSVNCSGSANAVKNSVNCSGSANAVKNSSFAAKLAGLFCLPN